MKKIAIWSSCAALVSCLPMAKRPILVEEVQALQLNVTTRDQVVEQYGKPQATTVSEDVLNACYRYDTSLLLVRYNGAGVLIGKSFNDAIAHSECQVLAITGGGASLGGGGASLGGGAAGSRACTMDVECGAGSQCSAGVCTGGISAPIFGSCVSGNFGKRVCSNTGASCTVDAECHR